MDKTPVREACKDAIPQEVVWWICGTGDFIYFALVWFCYKFLMIILSDRVAKCVFSYTPLEYKSIQTQGHLTIFIDLKHIDFESKSPRRFPKTGAYI
jgi:hypothetical protein